MQARAAEQLSDAMSGMVTKGNVEAEQEAARKKEEKRLAQEAEDARKVSLGLWFAPSCPCSLVQHMRVAALQGNLVPHRTRASIWWTT